MYKYCTKWVLIELFLRWYFSIYLAIGRIFFLGSGKSTCFYFTLKSCYALFCFCNDVTQLAIRKTGTSLISISSKFVAIWFKLFCFASFIIANKELKKQLPCFSIRWNNSFSDKTPRLPLAGSKYKCYQYQFL